MKLSIVDLSTVLPDESRHDALMHSIEVAQHIEKLGFHRIWVAEHHGSGSIAGRAPEILIGAIAANTKSIRVGSGSVLLNHYSPFKVAEVFCTLNELYPGRIDLGAGRATTGPVTDFALQQARDRQFRSNSDEQIVELVSWLDNSFPADHPFSKSPIHTIDSLPELYILGSSTWSASAAAGLGIRYVFAGFINQKGTKQILDSYRNNFKPSNGKSGIKSPEAILAVHVVCADTEAEAQRQIAPVNIMYRNLSKGIIDAKLPTPDEAVKELGHLPKLEKYVPGSGIPPKFIAGTPSQLHEQLVHIAKDLNVDEIIIQDMMTDHKARLHSYDLLAEVFDLKTK
ncbi:MsnO8 family LLM class oxidoreductase [Aequorivita sp. H23M31]|uniref:MsnO8 family LLM class oxidoreductase n=1 Tax=Aequorivita ciconiae TaxID=2494375 RepID=A0A410G5V5_9FLAO|nr:MsnO8 family LLM class oxidoreductase [Aequorivita sp. H23M31]QAA82643.1 MsnO8 family LLM class oxidoreductase [Aequorivita sp. H23M31]